jgi:hypothetical protein
MLVAGGVTALGLVLVAVTTQLYGYRLGGTISIPVLAVYTLKNAIALPVSLFSAVLAYVILVVVKDNTLVYGRDEFLVAILAGSIPPLILLLALGQFLSESLRTVLFIGSILPGLAAYNYAQLKPRYRKWDLLVSLGLFVVLVALGVLLVSPGFRETLGPSTPAVLYSSTADIAVWRGAVVVEELEPVILGRPLAVGLFMASMGLSEAIRRRYDVRIGVIAVALLAVYALASVRLLVLYAVVFGLSFLFIEAVHRTTLLYGRVLIGTTTAFALVLAVGLVWGGVIPVERGLSGYFVAVLAGVNAYSAHATVPGYRRLIPPLQVAAFVPLLVAARYFGRALPRGVPQELTLPILVGGAVVVLVCVVAAELYTVHRPDEAEVYRTSILSGGGEA